jgi:hypothetical protein
MSVRLKRARKWITNHPVNSSRKRLAHAFPFIDHPWLRALLHVPWTRERHSPSVPCHKRSCAPFLYQQLCICPQSGSVHACDGRDCPEMQVTPEGRVCVKTGFYYPSATVGVREVDWDHVQRNEKRRRRAQESARPVPRAMRVQQRPSRQKASRLNDMAQWRKNEDEIRNHITHILGERRPPEALLRQWTRVCEVQWSVLTASGPSPISLKDCILATLRWMSTPGGLTLADATPWIAFCGAIVEYLPSDVSLNKRRLRITKVRRSFQQATRPYFVSVEKGAKAIRQARERVQMRYRCRQFDASSS